MASVPCIDPVEALGLEHAYFYIP